MCGIAGLVDVPGAGVDRDALSAMAAALFHRGPDGSGVYVGVDDGLPHVGLAHTRLTILDPKGGVQPMIEAGRMALVFNGQIYNHGELRRRLEQRGHRFLSDHSDTETLLRSLLDDGAQAIAGFSGMFAFAAVDVAKRRLILARDRMGKKPLTIATPRFFHGAPRLAFASECVALEALSRRRADVDDVAVARYLAFDFVPDPDSIWQGALKLPPGHVVEVDLTDPESWSALRPREIQPLRFTRVAVPAGDDAYGARVDAVRAAVDVAVKDRLVHADVPVGVFLSGGLDSSLVAALAAQHTDNLVTFSVGFVDAAYDESPHARRVARHIGSTHHEVLLDEAALLDLVPRVGAHLSEPFADHSVIPTQLLAAFARERVTVALGGDGGDELFCGYPTFTAERGAGLARFAAARSVASWFAQASEHLPLGRGDLPLDEKLRRTLDGFAEPRPLRRHQRFLTGATHERVAALFHKDRRAGLGADLLAGLDAVAAAARAAGARDDVDVVTYGYLKNYLAAGVMQKVDRATMAVSLEARAPLLDTRVVDLALSLPASDKFDAVASGSNKRILKDAARGLVPDDILFRKKKGFGMPVARWLNGPLAGLVDDVLSPRAVANDGVFDPDAVGALLAEHRARRRDHRKVLWALLMWMLWRRRR